MPSKQSDAVNELYPSWTEARTTNPDRSLEEQREDLEHWGDATAEPGGDEYLESDAGGSPAMWLAPGPSLAVMAPRWPDTSQSRRSRAQTPRAGCGCGSRPERCISGPSRILTYRDAVPWPSSQKGSQSN